MAYPLLSSLGKRGEEESLKPRCKILIADRNPHVREFLKREMTAAGFQVLLAESGHEVHKQVHADAAIDLLIIDPDLPDADGWSLLAKLRKRLPVPPIILHTFLSDYLTRPDFPGTMRMVEKGGSSVELLKTAVFDILHASESEKKSPTATDAAANGKGR